MTAGRKVNTLSQDWCTPPKYAKPIEEFFGKIELDPCSNQGSIINAQTKLYDNGLEHNWNRYKTIYVNPPYGRSRNSSIYDWLKKCHETQTEIIALIPVATNTRHWKEFVFNSDVICFLADTRLKFMINGSTDNKGASMACCLVYWGKRIKEFVRKFSSYGNCCLPLKHY
jgi:hypothetical protein